MKKLFLIGALGIGKPATNGETYKNQLLASALRTHISTLQVIDTDNWRKRPWVLVVLFFSLLFNPKACFVLSACNGSVQQTLSIISKLRLKRQIYYWVIGGSIAMQIKSGERPADLFRLVDLFLVEGNSMQAMLKECGFDNVITVPNFKPITYLPNKKIKDDSHIKFVFLSRILPDKGCDLILDATQSLLDKGISNFSVSFFGPIESGYSTTFEKRVALLNNVDYNGFLNLKENKGYDKLAKYDAMLFPSYWDGEGFPGIIIDSYIASVPIIASDWNMNKDVVDVDKTGWLIPAKDVVALASKMEYVISNPSVINEMASYCKQKALTYDINNVVSIDLLKNINLIK